MERQNDDLFRGLGVEVFLPDEDSFLLIKETLERIGIPSFKNKEKTLYQSCHVLHKRGRYVIIHFLELFLLDGKKSTITDEDRLRRDMIALMLDDWGLCDINEADKKRIEDQNFDNLKIKVIKHDERNKWTRVCKYSIGSKRKKL